MSSNFSTFYTLPANDTRPSRRIDTERKGQGGKKKNKNKKKIHSHVPADNDRDSIRAECSRHLTTLRFATEMVGEGRVFAIGMKMWIYMLNETFEDSFTVVQVCCLHFFPFYLIDLMIE